jgi:hypothetical protein
MSERTRIPVKPMSSSIPSWGTLQRKCVCGGAPGVDGECAACRKNWVQRQPERRVETTGVPTIVHDVSRSSDRVLDPATRAFMVPRFGHDFSRIPTHSIAGGAIQTKLAMNKPGDQYEQDADRVADQVLTAPIHSAVSRAPLRIQRYAEQATEDAETASDSVDRVLASFGRSLAPALRQDMEQRFGHDFSQVRVHFGAAAEQSARDVNANAYTVGHNIVFGADRFVPETHGGRRLLAHELTHVVQQSGVGGVRVGRSSETIGLSSNNDTATSSSAQRSAPVASGLGHSHISVHRADHQGNGGGAAPPANTILPVNAATQAAPATADPTMTSGSLAITETKLDVVQQGGAILANTMGFKISKPFTISASAQVQEPPNAEPFEYGLVQNVFFDHIEEVFSEGDMLVDSVGPMVDCDGSSGLPFIHANAKMPTSLFTTLRVGPSFTDITSLEVMLNELHCKKSKSVKLKSVFRSAQFRAGLVARGLKTRRLVQLGAVQTTYGFEWQVNFTGPSFKSVDASNLTGSYPLSISASAVVIDGTIAGEEGQEALNAERTRFQQRCENVL